MSAAESSQVFILNFVWEIFILKFEKKNVKFSLNVVKVIGTCIITIVLKDSCLNLCIFSYIISVRTMSYGSNGSEEIYRIVKLRIIFKVLNVNFKLN